MPISAVSDDRAAETNTVRDRDSTSKLRRDGLGDIYHMLTENEIVEHEPACQHRRQGDENDSNIPLPRHQLISHVEGSPGACMQSVFGRVRPF